MIATHAYSLNGRVWIELQDSFGSPSEELRTLLGRLNGDDRYSLILCKLPDGEHLDEMSPGDEALQYIQSAGSATRLVVEVSRLEDGERASFLIGRPVAAGSSDPEEEVRWSNFVAVVHRSEVFDADEAATLFSSYYCTGSVPSEYVQTPGGAPTKRIST